MSGAGGRPDATSDRGLLALVALFVLTLPLVTPRVYAVDEIQYFAWVRSVWKDADVDFRNEFEVLLADRAPDAIDRSALLGVPLTPTGRIPSHGTVGFALAWAPLFAVGELAARAGPWPTDGYSYPYVAAICYGSALYAFLALLLLRDVGRRLLGPAPLMLATIAAWWGTALPFYMYVTPPMAHATALLAVAGFVWLWVRWRERPSLGGTAALALVGGLMTLVRENNALFLVLPGVDVLRMLVDAKRVGDREQLRRTATLAIVFGLVWALALTPLLASWRLLWGSWGPPPERAGFLHPWPRNLGALLGSANHGLLSWHPVWIVGIAGVVGLARERVATVAPLLLAFVLQLLFLGSLSNWSGGMAFGQRRLLSCLFIVVLGIAWLHRQRPRAAIAVTAVLIWLNLSLLLQFGTGMIPRSGPVSWSEVAYNHVVRVPRAAAGVAYSYLFDRGRLLEDR